MAAVIEALLPLLPKRRRARWREVLEGDPRKWKRLDMDDIFLEAGSLRSVDLEGARQDVRLRGNPVAIACCLTAPPHFLAGPLQEVSRGLTFQDGVVFAPDSGVVLLKHHESGWLW